MTTSPYIFIVGAPGSKWSGVARSIYFSPSINSSDFVEKNTYTHHGTGVAHLGTYFDPGMGYGEFTDMIEYVKKDECEREFERPFKDKGGTKIIKSHVLSTKLPILLGRWPDCPIVTVLRGDDACLDWWLHAGGFDIKFPSYAWYRNVDRMHDRIVEQNKAIREWINTRATIQCFTSDDLAKALNIQPGPADYAKDFVAEDTQVYVTL